MSVLLDNRLIWHPCQLRSKKLEMHFPDSERSRVCLCSPCSEIQKITQTGPLRLSSTLWQCFPGLQGRWICGVGGGGGSKGWGRLCLGAPKGAGTLQAICPDVQLGVISAQPQAISFPKRLLSRLLFPSVTLKQLWTPPPRPRGGGVSLLSSLSPSQVCCPCLAPPGKATLRSKELCFPAIT